MAIVCPECQQDACCHFKPSSPDLYIKNSKEKGKMTVARFAHLNHLVDQICCLSDAIEGLTPPSVATSFGMFYGLTAGTGNGGADDYPATVPIKTAAATGRIPFPRTGPLGTGILLGPANPSSTPANNFDSIILAAVGTYEVSFHVHTTERGQLQLELNGTDLADTLIQDYNPTSGGHLISGTSLITTVSINSVLAVINAVGNATALTVTQADGNLTGANSQSIVVKFLG